MASSVVTTLPAPTGLPSATMIAGGPTPSSYGPIISSSSSMYLYTFLATLLILLGVSSSIVLRSILLRRRQRILIENAIADGTWTPNRTRQRRNGRTKSLGAKPKMFVAALGKDDSESDGDSGTGKEKMKEEEKIQDLKWTDIFPVSATYVKPSTDVTPPTIPNTSNANSIPHTSPGQPTPPSTNTPSSDPKAKPDNSSVLRVSVLISMPSRNPVTADQEEIPPMEFGVAELHVTGKTLEGGAVPDPHPEPEDEDDAV